MGVGIPPDDNILSNRALYLAAIMDDARFDVVVEIFAVFTKLGADCQSRNQLRELKARALAMLSFDFNQSR
jgi:hypothetical protein